MWHFHPDATALLGATIKTDRREIAAEDFFTDLFETALEEDEVIVSVGFSPPRKCAYAKFASPASKYAVVDELRTDSEASAEYRAHLVKVMAKRAVKAAG